MSWLTQKEGMINLYSAKIHMGTQPIRVLNPMLLLMFLDTNPTFSEQLMKLIKDGGLNENFNFVYGEESISRGDGKFWTPRIDETRTLQAYETFLSYLWAISYSLTVLYIETIDYPKCNVVAGREKYKVSPQNIEKAKELFKYAKSLIKVFSPWDKNELPNPEVYMAENRDYVEQANIYYTEAMKFILCHEYVHVREHIHKIGKEITEESHYREAERHADKDAIEMIKYGMTSVTQLGSEIGIVVSILSTFFFSSTTTGIRHPNTEDRLTGALELLSLPEDHPAWALSCVGLELWNEQFNLQFDFEKGDLPYKGLYYKIITQIKEKNIQDSKS